MNSVQLHLALTHVPVILTLTALVIMVTGLIRKQKSTIKIANIMLVIAAILTIPVYFSGEGAEEIAEKISGVSEAVIEEHEEIAKLSFLAVIITGVFALASQIFLNLKWAKTIRVLTLALCLVTSGLFIQTAHLGGTIRHTELNGNTISTTISPKDDSEHH
jgi:uncharacterized membrane protein